MKRPASAVRARGNSLVRLLQMIEQLKLRPWTKAELAAEFKVTKRTIHRDLNVIVRSGVLVKASDYEPGNPTPRQFGVPS